MTRIILILSVFALSQAQASSILLHTRDGVVWYPAQTITGELSGFTAKRVTVHHNQLSFSTDISNDQQFAFEVTLQEKENIIWVEVPGNPAIVSDTIHYTLGYKPLPLVKPVATVTHDEVLLHATLVENPYQVPLKYVWKPASLNPAQCQIQNNEDSLAVAKIPDTNGIYYFDLLVIAEEDSVWFKTFVRRDAQGLHAFALEDDYPTWMDKAVVYQVTPYSFVSNGTLEDITAKLPELKSLGINTILLQPVYKTYYGEQGYDVTDYFAVNPDLGTEKQLQHLIATAKTMEIKVLLDVVLNHSSIHHPYAQDRIKYGKNSHYYDYYQHQKDSKPYSSYYNLDEYRFINYFWENLVNLNYQNEEVQQWMLEVCKYWVREFDIDGYRFDAIWGVNARKPSFAEKLRITLKSIQPEILLLAEDKGSVAEVYNLGYDAAYDWTADTTWVSQWSWEYEYEERKSHTIFNMPRVEQRGKMLRQVLFHNGGNEHRKLRYIENNDLPPFILTHGPERTKMAAALLFSLPGIPMLYNGQEIGALGHPYSTDAIFQRDCSIQALDENGLFSYYQKLVHLHKQYPALSDTAMAELPVAPGATMVAFHRWKNEEHFVVVINTDSTAADAHIDIAQITSQNSVRMLEDVLTGTEFRLKENLSSLKVPMQSYAVRWLLLKMSEN